MVEQKKPPAKRKKTTTKVTPPARGSTATTGTDTSASPTVVESAPTSLPQPASAKAPTPKATVPDAAEKLIEGQLERAEIKIGELESLVRTLKKERNEMTVMLSQAVERFRSITVAYHRYNTHPGDSYQCLDPRCKESAALYLMFGGSAHIRDVPKDPDAWWAERKGGTDGASDDTEEYEEVSVEAELAKPKPISGKGGTVEVDHEDMGWDPKYAGKQGRVAVVPDPQQEKDKGDPGPLSKMKASV